MHTFEQRKESQTKGVPTQRICMSRCAACALHDSAEHFRRFMTSITSEDPATLHDQKLSSSKQPCSRSGPLRGARMGLGPPWHRAAGDLFAARTRMLIRTMAILAVVETCTRRSFATVAFARGLDPLPASKGVVCGMSVPIARSAQRTGKRLGQI